LLRGSCPASPSARLPLRLLRLYGRSLYGALLLMVFGGLAVPAAGRQLLPDRRAGAPGRAHELDETLQRNADILALGMQESLWNMNADAARSLVESLMRDPAVLHVQVRAQAEDDFIDRRAAAAPERPRVPRRAHRGRARPADRPRAGRDGRQPQPAVELRAKQWRYAGVLAVQLAVSLLLIVLLLKRRLLAPLRSLTGFSDRLARGDFDTPLVLSSHDELGRLGARWTACASRSANCSPTSAGARSASAPS
jgi:HAMP domain-containing protein